jgi:cytochrome o ubiquinol oxidase subunit 2
MSLPDLFPPSSMGTLDPHGPVGAAELLILKNAAVVMLAVIVPVIALTLAFSWHFRAGNAKADYRPDWHYSGSIEFVVWAIPAMIVLFLGGIAWIGAHDLDPLKPLASPNKPLRVEVVAMDWKWLFIYPDLGLATVGKLVAPAGAPIAFTLTSATVMNSFLVPQLGGQIYAMNGMTTHLSLIADAPGAYSGLSSNISGEGFSDMRFEVDARDESGFRAWTDEARTSSATLDEQAYARLYAPGVLSKPIIYGAVAPDLFDKIVQNQVPPKAAALRQQSALAPSGPVCVTKADK